MSFPVSVNRRHKVGILLTLLLAGFILLNGQLSVGLGVLLVGIALTWILGGSTQATREAFRVLGWLSLAATFATALGFVSSAVILACPATYIALYATGSLDGKKETGGP